MDTDTLRSRIADDMPRTIDELSRLVSIPSIGYPGYDPAHVRASAELTGELLRGAGASNARLIELGDGHPAVFAEIPGPEGAPTILLYAHHDVQPEGDAAAWTIRALRPRDPRRPSVRPRRSRRQGRDRGARGRAPSAGRRRGRAAARDGQDRRRGRGGVLDGAPPRPRARAGRPAEGRRRGRGRRRQLPDRRAHDRHERARRDRLPGDGERAADRAAQRLERRPDPRRDHRARPHDRHASRRRRQRRDPADYTASNGRACRSPRTSSGRSPGSSTRSV